MLGEFDAAPVDVALLGQQPQQLAVAAADIENARARLDQFGDAQKIDARRGERSEPWLKQMPLARRPRR